MSIANPPRPVPPDFPRLLPTGGVPGVQPKLVVRLQDGKYVNEFSEDELARRFEFCDDLLQQLLPYCTQKRVEHPEWTLDVLLTKVHRTLRTKGWGITDDEALWLVECLRRQMESVPASTR